MVKPSRKKKQAANKVESIPKPQEDKIAERVIAEVTQSYQGPIPMASQLRDYEDVLPGAADRIIKMSENALKAEVRSGYMDRVGAFVSMLLSKGFLWLLATLATYLIINDKTAEGLLVGIAPAVTAIHSAFSDKYKNRNQKSEQKTD